MTKRLLALLAAATLAAPLGAAEATTGSVHHGRCVFHLFNHHLVTGSEYGGFHGGVVALRSDDVAGNPVTATVTCELRVNAWIAASASATGTGVVVVAEYESAYWESGDAVEVCTVVDFADATPTATECVPRTVTQVPPQVVYDTLDATLDQVWAAIDPVYCPVLAEQAPGIGPVRINDQGDVYVANEPVWDCPPFDVEW